MTAFFCCAPLSIGRLSDRWYEYCQGAAAAWRWNREWLRFSWDALSVPAKNKPSNIMSPMHKLRFLLLCCNTTQWSITGWHGEAVTDQEGPFSNRLRPPASPVPSRHLMGSQDGNPTSLHT